MGESGACLMQPFCYASGIFNEANESKPIHALGQSVSFGRFTSESLSWERWSTFSHNRYVEEAESYSRPGSVAQKKAFFEAHYKKLAAQKAAALLEQAKNAESNNVQEQQDEGVVDVKAQDSQTTSPNSDPDAILRSTGHDSNSNKTESNRNDEADPEREQEAFVAVNSMKVELQNQLQGVDANKGVNEKIIGTPRMDKPQIKLQQNTNSDEGVSASKSEKKPSVYSSKLLKDNGASKFTSTPAKHTAPIPFTKDNLITPMYNKPALSSADKRATPKSLHMTVNFSPIRELNRLTASVRRRFESSRAGSASSKPSKDSSTLLRTPTMATKNEPQNHASVTPLTERTKTPSGSSVSGSNTSQKWRLLSAESAEKKMRSPVISSPFSLRTEERAARRKKKLEEKFNDNEAQKVQLHTKLKEKAETEIRKLRQSFCFKARPLPDFYKERKVSKEEITREPLTYPESPKQERKPSSSAVENKSSLPPQRPSLKNNGTRSFLGKNSQTTSHPLTSNGMMITHENTSPNVQHPTQHDRNYK